MRHSALLAALALARAAPAAPANPCGVDQVRIALTAAKDGSSMLVSWATAANATPADYAGVVRFGPTPASLPLTSSVADSRNYTMCSLPSPFLHAVKLTGLKAGATYYYSVADAAGRCGATAPTRFVAPRVVGDKATAWPLRVFAYGDMGVSNSNDTAAFITARVDAGTGPDVITHAGDIAYADDRGCPRYESILNEYYNEISPYASRTPVMFSSGNHEIFSKEGSPAGDFLAYRMRNSPTMPIADAAATPYWYSFDVGRVHFLAFDIDQPYAVDSAQHAFIVADLNNVDRAVTPIVYAFSHFPMLCSNYFWCNVEGPSKSNTSRAMEFRAVYEPIFNAPATRVHVFVNGHVHAAEVPLPVATGALVPSQPDWRNTKTLFQALLGFPGDIEVCCNKWILPAPAYSGWRTDDVARDGGTFGFGELIFTSDTEMTFRAWSAVNRSVLFEASVSFA